MVFALADPRPDGLLVIEHPYFEVEGGTQSSETSTSVAHEGESASPETVHFNHGLGEIFNAGRAAEKERGLPSGKDEEGRGAREGRKRRITGGRSTAVAVCGIPSCDVVPSEALARIP